MEEKISISQAGVRYGIYLAIVSIIYSTLLQILGLVTNRWLGYVSIIFVIVALVLAHNEYKKSNEFMSYGQGLSISMIIVVISTVVSSLFTFVYIKFIDNSMLEQIRQQSEEQMMKRGMSDEQIQQAMTISSKFMTPVAITIMGIIIGVIFGTIVSLIVTAITKKNPPETVA